MVTLILKWVINHQNWAILRGEHWSYFDCKSVLAPVQLIRGVPSILSSDQRKIWNGKLETVADQTRLDRLVETVFHGHLTRFEIHFGIKFFFVAYLIWPFAISSFSRLYKLLDHLAQTPHRGLKFEYCLAQIYFEMEKRYLEISKLLFKCEVMQLFLTGFSVNYCLWEIFAIKNFWRVTSKLFLKKSCKGKRCANFFKFSRQKS